MLPQGVRGACYSFLRRGGCLAYDPKQLLSILTGAAPPDLDVTCRAMSDDFVGCGHDKAFASLSYVDIAWKVAGNEREAILALPGAEPLRYEPDQPASKSYMVVPAAMLSETQELRSWIVRSVSSLPAGRIRKRA